MIAVEQFSSEARAWLDGVVPRRPPERERVWGEGSDNVAVFQTLSHDEERAALDDLRTWQRVKHDAGYGSITWPREYGGAGLSRAHEEAFRRLEREYIVPASNEAMGISLGIEAPTILTLGTPEQKAKWLPGLLRADLMCCQLFSEPAAGSDLGSLGTRAERDGDTWVVNGQKVWTTGAQFADLGYLIARTDPNAPRQTGCTAFVVEMRAPGIEVRPLKQMTGGTSFNEVFFSDVRLPDSARLGEVGGGWHAAMTTLGFERSAGSAGGGSSTVFELLVLAAREFRRSEDRVVRDALANAYVNTRVRSLTNRRAAAKARAGRVPGPEGSIGKLAFTNGLTELAAVASLIVGHRLTADSGAWGTYAWHELITGTPGWRIAGGTDEIQRNTIAERVLGLPREPRP